MNIASLSWKGRSLILLSILLGLGVTIYSKSLYALGAAVLHRLGSSHGLFVPFISVYLVGLKLDKIKKMPPQNALVPGGAMIGMGFVLLRLSRNSEGIGIPIFSFILIAGGLIFVLFGKVIFREIVFPMFFLLAMIPLPETAYNQIAEWMRQATTLGAVTLTKLIGIPLYREGFDVFLPDSHLHVGYSCSGIRYLLSYLVFGVFYAFRFKRSFTSRALVVIGAVPLSIVGGVLRLGIIFSSCYLIGPIMIEHNPHVILSWTVFTVMLAGLIAVDRHVYRKKVLKVKKTLA